MIVDYACMNPTRNMTVIVRSAVPRERQGALAARLMARGGDFAEQVGFLEPASRAGARARLQMMGGEFCGNATMSLAALLAEQDGLPEGREAVYPLEISGAENVVDCRICREGAGFRAWVNMPLPESVEAMEISPDVSVPLVRFAGIAHLLVPEEEMDAAEAQRRAPELCALLNADALGIQLTSADLARIRPLVYVRGTRSMVWERGCGSGTAAVGAYAAARAKRNAALEVEQPGGRIRVRAEWRDGAVRKITISGRVFLEEMGTLEVGG